MNDPGLDEPIASQSTAVDDQHVDEKEEALEEEQAFLAPSRWWFASTAFPLIAGTFGPMASAFSICALVVHWRMIITPGNTEEQGIYIDDPKWLVAVNAVQLAIALISNLFLLLNMARRVRFSVAQPITIIGWYISSFTLIGLCATACGPLLVTDPRGDMAFTGAFYYGAFAAGLYFLVASLMVITVYGAFSGHYDRDFKLTMSQRTLMLQTISFLVYLLAGAAVFAHIESWEYLDAIYWADFTLLTVGVGDFAPTTHTGRSLLFPFAIGGIIILGLVIGSIRSLVLERGKVKMEARMVEKERERTLKRFEKKNKTEILEPISKSSSETRTDSFDNERDRRKEEFDLMRRVQKKAAERRRWMALAISATTWFALWFAGAAILQQTEEALGWSYFVALYFCYTSLLTIGYGDIYPTSNSGKAFFVFWSLLAIPSLTILISNMGDTIVKGIRDLTLWIGEFTVLPGEGGVRTGLKKAAHTITGGKIFEGKIQESPPGILGEMNRHDEDSDSEDDGGGQKSRRNDPESAAQGAAGHQKDADMSRAKQESKTGDKNAKPKSQKHYHLMLIKEIGNVTKHLSSSPPRKYTFDEWAWYLKLIGEDESDPSKHRKPLRKPKEQGEGLGTQTEMPDQGKEGDHDASNKNRNVKWSWVGNRSPLMGNKEEAEWVLERLTKTLERELEDLRREEEEGKGAWSRGGEMEGSRIMESQSPKPKQSPHHETKAAKLIKNLSGNDKVEVMVP